MAAAKDRLNQVQARISHAKAQSSRADVLLGWTQIRPPPTLPAHGLVDPGNTSFPEYIARSSNPPGIPRCWPACRRCSPSTPARP